MQQKKTKSPDQGAQSPLQNPIRVSRPRSDPVESSTTSKVPRDSSIIE